VTGLQGDSSDEDGTGHSTDSCAKRTLTSITKISLSIFPVGMSGPEIESKFWMVVPNIKHNEIFSVCVV